MKMFRKLLVFAGILGILVLVAVPVRADRKKSMPTKYVQLPDLSTTGMDVNATFWKQAGGSLTWPFVKILADDFPCRTTGPITSIRIWGSWLFDKRNAKTKFKLSIHDDVPATTEPGSYSYPGKELWSEFFAPRQYKAKVVAIANEQFYEPNQDAIIGHDARVWQYNFFPKDPFIQQGTATDEKVYWLDVQAMVPLAAGATTAEVFGWKTSFEHWNDDATFADTDSFGGSLTTPWKDMHYPVGHPYAGRTIDLAFAITPEPGTMLMILAGATTALVAGAWRRRRRTA